VLAVSITEQTASLLAVVLVQPQALPLGLQLVMLEPPLPVLVSVQLQAV
jgi:hypothetical protein